MLVIEREEIFLPLPARAAPRCRSFKLWRGSSPLTRSLHCLLLALPTFTTLWTMSCCIHGRNMMIRHPRSLLRRNKNYSGIRVSGITENLNGDKPLKMSDRRYTQYMGWHMALLFFHHLWWKWTSFTPVKQDEDLIPFPMCWFPSKLMPMWVLNTRAAFRVFLFLRTKQQKLKVQ